MKFIFTCFLLSLTLFSISQNTFKTHIFGPYRSYINQITQLNDSSFVGTGSIYLNSSRENNSLFLFKTDNNGNVLASKALTNFTSSRGNSVVKTNDGGFVLCGTSSNGQLIIKFASNLSLQWAKVYTIPNGTLVLGKIQQTSDGNYLIAGNAAYSDSSGNTSCLLKTDASGNAIFLKRYSNYGRKQTLDVTATSDGNYALLSMTNDTGTNDTTLITKIKPDGSILWTRYLFDNILSFLPSSVTTSSDGGVVLTGHAFTLDPNVPKDELLMAKYNNDGNLLWSKTMVSDGISGNYAGAVIEDKDGDYLFAGELDTYLDEAHKTYDTSYGYLVKTDASGVLQWAKTYEPLFNGSIIFNSLIRTSSNNYITAGEGYFYNKAKLDYEYAGFVYKLNESFQTCNESPSNNGTIQNLGTSAAANAVSTDIGIITDNASPSLTDTGTIEYVCNSVLPLHLLSFNATLHNKNVSINWSTINEVNTSYFTVERSTDGTSFSALQKVPAKGNITTTQSYNTADLQPLQGKSYYRLQQVDKDGKVTYSAIVPVNTSTSDNIIISPNPVKNTIKVVIQSEAITSTSFQIIDITGKVLIVQKATVTIGDNQINIPASLLPRGVYMLRIIRNKKSEMIRFIKE